MTIHESVAPVAQPPLAETLYSALEELARAQRDAFARLARRLDWPRAGVGVIRLLAACGPVQLTDVATKLRVDVSVASRHVAQLVDAGYVRRTVDTEDRRARVLDLTTEGHALADRLTAQFTELLDETFTGWTRTEIADATDHIRRVAAAISASRDLSHHHEEGTH